jgi:eukaryotic-like serine/threonine-protein kinase
MADPQSPVSDGKSDVSVAAPAKFSGRAVQLGDNFEIFFDHPVPRLNQTRVRVYHAKNIRGDGCHAYVCDRRAIPRLQMIEKYAGILEPVAAKLLGRGIVLCPDGFERYALIYENSMGQPVIPDQGEIAAYAMKSDIVFNAVFKPILALLKVMHNSDLVHGAIRANNLFDGGTRPLQRIVLGDCLAQPFAAAQPLLYMAPHQAAASTMGRGFGVHADDIYALGVTCAVLMRTHDPLAGKTDQDIFISKLEMGSFSTLIESERLPSNILELMRGMLNDDPIMRWDINDISEWLEGRRVAGRSGTKRLKASRHIELGTHKILLPSVFAYYAAQDTVEAAKLVDSGEIKQWITRSISDTRLEERYAHALDSAQEFGRDVGFQDRLISRIATALEPFFPIFFRGQAVFPESLGNCLAELIVEGRDPKPIADMINDQAPMYWMNIQPEVPSDINLVSSKFEQCQQFLKQRTIGYGLERVLYFLAPDVPCLSPRMRGAYVSTPEELVKALNTIAEMNDRPDMVFDRHIAAFLSMRDRKAIDHYLPDLNSSEKFRQISATINILAAIQQRSKLPPMVGLTRWLATLAEPLLLRFHDRDMRTTMAKKLADIKEKGYIIKLSELLLGTVAVQRDQQEFRHAMNTFYQLKLEDFQLHEAMKSQDIFGTQTGREIATLIAGFIVAIGIAGFVVIRFGGGGSIW